MCFQGLHNQINALFIDGSTYTPNLNLFAQVWLDCISFQGFHQSRPNLWDISYPSLFQALLIGPLELIFDSSTSWQKQRLPRKKVSKSKGAPRRHNLKCKTSIVTLWAKKTHPPNIFWEFLPMCPGNSPQLVRRLRPKQERLEAAILRAHITLVQQGGILTK